MKVPHFAPPKPAAAAKAAAAPAKAAPKAAVHAAPHPPAGAEKKLDIKHA